MELTLGNTKVIFNDQYCRGQTEEQRCRTFQRVSKIAYEALFRQAREAGSGNPKNR